MSDIGVKIVKVLNAGSAIVLAFAGFWIAISQLINGHFNIASFFGPFFFVFFGFLLVANEIKFGHVLNEYGFLKTFLGRGLFYIFLSGVVCYGYYSIADNYVAGNIYGTVFFVLGVFYLLMNFYPKGSLGNISRVLLIYIYLISLYRFNDQSLDIFKLQTYQNSINNLCNNLKLIKKQLWNHVQSQNNIFKILYYQRESNNYFSRQQNIYMIYDESRLQHRLKDKFYIEIIQLISLVEKQKYDATTNENCKWQNSARKNILEVGLKRKDINSQIQQPQSHSIGQTLVQSRLTQGSAGLNRASQKQNQHQESSNSIYYDENKNQQLKLESLKQKYQEQAKLIVKIVNILGIKQMNFRQKCFYL